MSVGRAARSRFSATTTWRISKSCSPPAAQTGPKLVVFESLYSMDGDVAPVNSICDLTERYGAVVIGFATGSPP
jgi:7-keto-8-aminopelargonate synthetase-like enzyme